MKHPKTHRFPLVPALLVPVLATVLALPAAAQVRMELSSRKEYRQNKKEVGFKGGRFDIKFTDGSVTSIGACNWFRYYPPGTGGGVCAVGSTGLITSGTLDGAVPQYPYLLVTSVVPAVIVEPRSPELVTLNAAPASKLRRPAGGFVDNSTSIFYNLHTVNDIREYVIARYDTSRTYNAKQRSKFESEIVTGVYQYKFPRLNNPNLFGAVSAVIYPMPEGLAERNNKLEGFGFTKVNGRKLRWVNDFVELSARRPNVVSWSKLSPSSVFPSVDDMFISLKQLDTPGDPKSEVVERNLSIFPQFSTGSDAKIRLASPLVESFTFPPVLESGTTAILEVELQRNFQTGGVTFDFSTRRFQLPVVVLDRYTDYANIVFGRSKTPILRDSDNDGYNNLTEWILESDANQAGSIPVAPVPRLVQEFVDPVFGSFGEEYFGFNVRKKMGTIPAVNYELQRSTDNGATWSEFLSDDDWIVEDVTFNARGMSRSEIQVRSTHFTAADPNNPLQIITPIQPPGTAAHRYRVKITLN